MTYDTAIAISALIAVIMTLLTFWKPIVAYIGTSFGDLS